jgi:chorismate-pyruvate lyase
MDSQRVFLPDDAFDPTSGLFVAQKSRPAVLLDVDLQNLNPFLRTLLVIDGTVTKFLEAFAMESMVVRRLGQVSRFLDSDDEWLETRAGEKIVNRRVMLIGNATGRLYTYAESAIVHGRLSAQMQDGLDNEAGGLGKILLDSELETRREGLWFGRERPEDLPAQVQALWESDFLTRTYRVIANGAPLMAITERFPYQLEKTQVEKTPA